MRKFTLFLAALCCAVMANALDPSTIFYQPEGIRYELTLATHQAIVVSNKIPGTLDNYVGLSGHINIPATIEYNHETYQVTAIADEAFIRVKHILSVTIEEGVTTVGSLAFGGCPCLKSVTLPESVTAIGDAAFADCMVLQSLTLPDGLTVIPANMCSYCMDLKTLHLPASLVEIGEEAFMDCYGLIEIEIPDGTAFIGAGAFQDCTNLRTLTLPASVAQIGDNAFGWCRSLDVIKCHITPPLAINENVFTGVDCKHVALCVPNQSVNTYRSYNVWKKFYVNPLILNISFVVNGQTVYSLPLEYGTPATTVKEEAKAVEQQMSIPAGKVFKHWNPEITWVTRDQVYEAVIEPAATVTQCKIQFAVNGVPKTSFLLNEGSSKADVEYLASLFLDQVDMPADLEFKYWEPALAAVTDNQTYNAVFDYIDQNSYPISFVINGETVFTVDLKYGTEDWIVEGYANAVANSAVYPEGMTFKDWDKYFDKVTGPETYTARLRPIGQGIDQPTSDSSLKGRGQKVIKDGQLLINRNGKTYNAQGAEVK